MGSMSMSDAAPLPRLGEVFFDVRSTSRTLRISWYADTGVAVLSIWQGGTCTGSFRLPMGDLPRMIEALQRGPDSRAASAEGYAPHAAEGEHAAAAISDDPYPAGTDSLRYLNGSAPAHYPDQAAAGYPDSPAPAHYPDQAAAGYPDSPARVDYRDEPMPSWYPDEPGPADYPARVTHRDFPAEPPGGSYPNDPYPNGTESLDHPLAPAGIDRPHPAPGSPYGHGQPGRADEQPAPSWDSTAVVPADNGLEPLRESFPHGEPRHSHRR